MFSSLPGKMNSSEMQSMNVSNFQSEVGDFAVSTDFNPYDFDYSKIMFLRPLKTLPQYEIVIKIIFYVIIICISIVGNTVIIVVIYKNQRLHTTTNGYIINLAVSDLIISGICSWLFLVDDLTEGWVLGPVLCKISTQLQVTALVSSTLTLTLISGDRFFGIIFAFKAHFARRRAKFCIILVWITAIGVGIPLFIFQNYSTRQWKNFNEKQCYNLWPAPVMLSRLTYYTTVTTVLFFTPITIMSVAYGAIIWKMLSKRQPGELVYSETSVHAKHKRKVLVMLVVLLVVFIICWLPLQVSILVAEYRGNKHQSFPTWWRSLKYAAMFLAHTNAAANPLIYALFNQNFQRAFKVMLKIQESTTRSRAGSTNNTIKRDSTCVSNNTMVSLV